MAPHQLLSLLALFLIASYNMPMVESKKVSKNKGSKPKLPQPNEPLVAFRKFRVEIHNQLHMYLLDSHCYSEDNDLGLHVLFPDQQQDWSFKGNWLGRTIFHCRLEWERGFIEFDAFYRDADFVTNYCVNNSDDPNDVSVCVWSAAQDGVYLTRYDGQLVHTLSWNLLRP